MSFGVGISVKSRNFQTAAEARSKVHGTMDDLYEHYTTSETKLREIDDKLGIILAILLQPLCFQILCRHFPLYIRLIIFRARILYQS